VTRSPELYIDFKFAHVPSVQRPIRVAHHSLHGAAAGLVPAEGQTRELAKTGLRGHGSVPGEGLKALRRAWEPAHTVLGQIRVQIFCSFASPCFFSDATIGEAELNSVQGMRA